MKPKFFLIPVAAIMLSLALVSAPATFSTAIQSIPGVGPDNENPFSEGVHWTYNRAKGTLCNDILVFALTLGQSMYSIRQNHL